jgi:hypothetical protein
VKSWEKWFSLGRKRGQVGFSDSRGSGSHATDNSVAEKLSEPFHPYAREAWNNLPKEKVRKFWDPNALSGVSLAEYAMADGQTQWAARLLAEEH